MENSAERQDFLSIHACFPLPLPAMEIKEGLNYFLPYQSTK